MIISFYHILYNIYNDIIMVTTNCTFILSNIYIYTYYIYYIHTICILCITMLSVHTYTEFVGCQNIEHSGPVDRYPHVVCISRSYDCTSVHQIGPLFAGHRFPYRGLCNLRLHASRFSGLWLRVWKKEKWEQERMI